MGNTPLARLLRRLLLAGLLLATGWILARAPLPAAHASTAPQPQKQGNVVGEGPNRAALVVRYDDGSTQQRCVAFPETEIGGDQLLERSGLNPVISADGAVCSIAGQGCPSDDCFCQCPFPNCKYWAYYHGTDGGWDYSQAGAALSVVHDGTLEGWSWGEGNFSQAVEPPQMTFDQICPAAAGDATATPTATATTQTGAASAPPQVTFYSALPRVAPGQCTTVSWQTTDATAVMLDGAPVALQGSQQFCPTGTQTWNLLASNAAGQTPRQVTVEVDAAAVVPATSTAGPFPTAVRSPTVSPAVNTPRAGLPTRIPAPVITQAPRALPTTGSAFSPLATDVGLFGNVPLAATAEPLIAPTLPPPATPTRFLFELPPTETPRPRHALGADGRPTPTPILIARVGGGSAPNAPDAKNATRPQTAPDASQQQLERLSFSLKLLPGYAAYAATLAVLVAMAWFVLRRRHAPRPAPIRHSGDTGEQEPRTE